MANIPVRGDQLVKTSDQDDYSGFLEDKLTAGTGITLTKQNTGANENIQISASVTGGDADWVGNLGSAPNDSLGITRTGTVFLTDTSATSRVSNYHNARGLAVERMPIWHVAWASNSGNAGFVLDYNAYSVNVTLDSGGNTDLYIGYGNGTDQSFVTSGDVTLISMEVNLFLANSITTSDYYHIYDKMMFVVDFSTNTIIHNISIDRNYKTTYGTDFTVTPTATGAGARRFYLHYEYLGVTETYDSMILNLKMGAGYLPNPQAIRYGHLIFTDTL